MRGCEWISPCRSSERIMVACKFNLVAPCLDPVGCQVRAGGTKTTRSGTQAVMAVAHGEGGANFEKKESANGYVLPHGRAAANG